MSTSRLTGSRSTVPALRRPVMAVAALSLVAVMAGGGYAIAHPTTLDRDPHPLDLGSTSFPMKRSEAEAIARQLAPVKPAVTPRQGPRPAMPAFVTPQVHRDSWYSGKGHNLSHYTRGQIIDKRASTFTKLYFPTSKATTYLYRSTDARGYPIAATATLLVPPTFSEGKNVFVWAHPINSSGADCRASSALSTAGQSSADGITMKALTGILALGHPVLFTDGEGPRDAYAINRMSAHIILDGLRMVHRQKDTPLRHAKFVLMGISHGGLMMGLTAVEQPTYAPELTRYINQIIVHESAPDFIKLSQTFGLYGLPSKFPAPYAGFVISYLIGAYREYPDKLRHLEDWLTDYGKLQVKAHRSLCMPVNTAIGNGVMMRMMFKDGFFESKSFRTLMQIAKESSTLYYPTTPKVPVMLVHGTLDYILYQHEEERVLFKRWCDAGVNVVYQEIPLGDHYSAVIGSLPRVVGQSIASLNDVPQKSSCPNKVII